MEENNNQVVNPTATPVMESNTASPKKGGKAIMILIVIIALCCIITGGVAGAVYYLGDQVAEDISNDLESTLNDLESDLTNELDSMEDDTPGETGDLFVDAGEEKYSNTDYSFSMIVPDSWEVTSFLNEVEIISDIDGGQINFQALEDPTFVLLEELDQDFCDSFGEGFREGLGDIESADQFQFELFTLNGNTGCRADGEIVPGVFQRHYIFFNDDTDYIYSLFYTTGDQAVEEPELAGVMDTFDFTE